MAKSASRIKTDINYDRAGKQVSYLRAPSSTNESAYGTVAIPITVIKGGEGPTVFLTGGVHGDEYEGPLALIRVARKLRPDEINGRVIIVPCLNLPAVQVAQRLSPIDNLNLNRVFPGSRDGSLSLVIAHYVSTVLLPMTDVQIDLHSGGKTLEFIPTIQMNETGDTERDRLQMDAMKAFGAPIALVNKNPDDAGLLEFECEKFKIVNLSAELGGGGTVSRRGTEIAETGVMNILRHFKVTDGAVVKAEERAGTPTRLMRIVDGECYVMAPDDGLYESFFELGESVSEGDALGKVHYLHHADKEPWAVQAARSGTLICKRPPGKVMCGDNVGIIAQDF